MARVGVACAGLQLLGCDAPFHPRAAVPGAASDKATPRFTNWVAIPEVFGRDLHLHSLAATPNRLLATTLGSAVAKVVSISETGHGTPFSRLFSADADARCVVAVAPGWSVWFPMDDVYVSRGREVFRLGADGSMLQPVTALPEAELEVAGMCFDPSGQFQHGLVIVGTAGGVYLFDGVRPLARIAALADRASGAAIPAAGLHAGRLLVAFSARSEVVAVTPSGQTSSVLGWSGVSSVQPLSGSMHEFGRSHGTLFVATDDGTLLRFPLESVGERAGSLVLTSVYASGNGLAEPDGTRYRTRPFSPPWGAEHCAAIVQPMAFLQPAIDVQPASRLNTLQPGSATRFAVAVLNGGWFRVADLDLTSVRLAGAMPLPVRGDELGIFRDIDGDGSTDLELFFRPCDLQVSSATAHVTLSGELITGEPVRATDRIVLTGENRSWTPRELGDSR